MRTGTRHRASGTSGGFGFGRAALALATLLAVGGLGGCAWVGGVGEARIDNPFTPDVEGDLVTAAQLRREAERELAAAGAEAAKAIADAEATAKAEAAEIERQRADNAATFAIESRRIAANSELSLAELQARFDASDREATARIDQLLSDVSRRIDAANAKHEARIAAVRAALDTGRETLSAIEANRTALADGASKLLGLAGSVGVPGAGLIAALIPTVLTGIGWARSSAKAQAAEAKQKAADAAWDEATAAAEKQRTGLDATWDAAQAQSLLTALLAERLGMAKTSTSAAGAGTDAPPVAIA